MSPPVRFRGACDIGLWRHGRHPNQLAAWLGWTGVVLAAAPSRWALRGTEPTALWLALGVGSVGASARTYTTLVYLTGAVPAE